MSTQSILVKSIESVQDNSRTVILDNAKKHILSTDFALGNGMNSNEVSHYSKLFDLLNTENCELILYINEAIENGGEAIEKSIINFSDNSVYTISDYSNIFEENLI